MYFEGVKYSLSCHGASVSWLGSMVCDLFALQVLSILGSRGMSSGSSDRRPSIHPTIANKFNVFFLKKKLDKRNGRKKDLERNVLRESYS